MPHGGGGGVMSFIFCVHTLAHRSVVYLADILSAFCIRMGCEGTLIDLTFI